LADSEHNVFIWARESEIVKSLNETHKNPKYLTHHTFPSLIRAIGPELPSKEELASMDVVLFAIPTQVLRENLVKIKDRFDYSSLPLLVFVNKGIEIDTQALTLEIIADTLGGEAARVATFLSGPSFAKEIIKRQPTQVSISSISLSHAQQVADLFHQPWFRCYPGEDPIGVELAGALKNIYAIVAGIAAGQGYEMNTRAGLITRSLAEMTRIGVAYGASPLTFLTLAGVGDLFLTCSSPTSRNYTVGRRLGEGEELQHILDTLGSVAEGVTTTKGANTLVKQLDVYAPIVTGIYAILYEGKNAQEISEWLLNQPPAAREVDLPEKSGKHFEGLMRKLGL
jgi:glycerol-3-phosphate dehydrogenase